ncbi:MAG: Gfo/Idh/MocA family oxidoreductase [Chloroflexota bacterium]|nr:Gfo/Idh/MocA family oxidoreductase [Chloroflexota bacterium]
MSRTTTLTADRRWPLEHPPSRRLRVGIVGCGDVAHRRYLPALADLAESVEVVGCCDPSLEEAARAAASVESWSSTALAYSEIDRLMADAAPDAIFNLTPAPAHGALNQAALEAGVHVYSEKPIASSLADADRLITTANEAGLLLLCAPASAATGRLRWLKEIVDSQRFGPLTLAVAHHADPGPAAWREYTGDPSVFYREGVGPVFDHGIYRLHELTMLMGPVGRVQAMGSIGSPQRIVRGGPFAGRTIEVTTPDHVLINLEFGSGAIGQLLASFGTAATQAPWLELHFTKGTISFPGVAWERDASASIYIDDDSPLGLEGWVHGIQPPPPPDPLDVVETGVVHFVSVLNGAEPPVLTAEHARHVLDVILQAYASISDGQSHETQTTF